MNDSKQRHGNHTWDLNLHYYRCPQCGYILENREKFERRYHELFKELACPRCRNKFDITKSIRPAFGPLLGHDPEVNE